MNKIVEPLTFTVPLSLTAHSLAQQYCKSLRPQRVKQVYLNTLAVYAVDTYLQCLGYETEAQLSSSCNPFYLSFLDTAALGMKQIGMLECRPVLPGSQVCQIPAEAWSDRIGYIAVSLNRSLNQATLIGFTPTPAATVPLEQLQSLAELPQYLNNLRQSENTIINLKSWFEGVFEAGWQRLDAVLVPQRLVALRNQPQLVETRRAKIIDLGVQLGGCSVILVVMLNQIDLRTVNIKIQVYPIPEEAYLPFNLQLTMLSPSGEILQKIRARRYDNYIQLRKFTGEFGDRFTLELALNDAIVCNGFVI